MTTDSGTRVATVGDAATTVALVVDRRRLRRMLLAAVGAVVAVNLALGVVQVLAGELGWLALLDAGEERSVPTWFAVVLLAAGAVTAAHAGTTARRRGAADRGWTWLAVAVAAASVDEGLALHEELIDPVGDAIGAGGLLTHAWVVPGVALAAVLAVAFAGFLRRRRPAVRRGLVVAAALYLGGALGVEMVGGWLLDTRGPGVATGLAVIVEETLELLGAVVLLDVLLGVVASAPESRGPVATPGITGGAQGLVTHRSRGG